MLSNYIAITAKGKACVETEEINVDGFSENEAVIKCEASMISAGTELSRVFEIKKGFSYPVRPGYSAVGKVIGKGSKLDGIEIGDRVFYSGPHSSVCRIENGNKTQGQFIFKLNEDLQPESAALLNLGLIAANGACHTEIKPGDVAAVFGLGVIGLLVAIMYKEAGAYVIGVDPVASRCEVAKSLGIVNCVSASPENQVSEILALTGGLGADICTDVTGDSRAIANAVFSTAKYGQVVLLGTPRADCEMNVAPVFNKLHMNMITLKGAFNNLYPPREAEGCRITVERNLRYVERLMAAGKIDTQKIISHIIKPEEVQEAYHGLMYDREAYRCVVINWD